jgi:ATP-binding cassette subfamily B protein
MVVLDEPSSALDPKAEHETFERFAALSSSARSEGAIVIFVSHRLSTTLRADLIVMMHDATVLDVGTHDHLVDRCTPYAELFEMQAARYRD